MTRRPEVIGDTCRACDGMDRWCFHCDGGGWEYLRVSPCDNCGALAEAYGDSVPEDHLCDQCSWEVEHA